MIELDKLLDKNLEHIGEALEQAPGTYAVRTDTALECGADLTFEIDVEQGQQSVNEQEANTYSHTFNSSGEPTGKEAHQPVVDRAGYS